MDTYNHFSYGQRLSNALKFFSPGIEKGSKVFFTAPNSDNLFSISQKLSEINYPVLVAVNGFDSDYDDNEGDSLFEKSQYYFMLLQPALSDDADDILAKQEACKQNAMQIQCRLKSDSRHYQSGLTNLMHDSFSIRSIGPLGTNLYGVVMGFIVYENKEYSIINDYWK